jgi:hypothetical protein
MLLLLLLLSRSCRQRRCQATAVGSYRTHYDLMLLLLVILQGRASLLRWATAHGRETVCCKFGTRHFVSFLDIAAHCDLPLLVVQGLICKTHVEYHLRTTDSIKNVLLIAAHAAAAAAAAAAGQLCLQNLAQQNPSVLDH